ncbi:hypothetical protein GCM10027590_33880 [Nocardiopsis nanhaiensis]
MADEQGREDENQPRHGGPLQNLKGKGGLLPVGGEIGDHPQQTSSQHEKQLQHQCESLASPHIVSEGSRIPDFKGRARPRRGYGDGTSR